MQTCDAKQIRWPQVNLSVIDKINNIASSTISSIQNIVRWSSDRLDGAVVARCLGTPGQTKVSGDHQREPPHEICCLAAKYTKKILDAHGALCLLFWCKVI